MIVTFSLSTNNKETKSMQTTINTRTMKTSIIKSSCKETHIKINHNNTDNLTIRSVINKDTWVKAVTVITTRLVAVTTVVSTVVPTAGSGHGSLINVSMEALGVTISLEAATIRLVEEIIRISKGFSRETQSTEGRRP